MKREKSCGAVIFREDMTERYYLILTSTQGHTTLCKGHVEGKETEHETAVREILEETGLTVGFVDGLVTDVVRTDSGRVASLKLGGAELSGGAPACQPEEVADIRFLPFEDALAALTHPSDRDTLQKAQTFLEDR